MALVLALLACVATVPERPRWVEVGAGVNHACARSSEGEIRCWGRELSDRLVVPEVGPFRSLGVGYLNACAVTEAGEMVCWGNNQYDQNDPPEGDWLVVHSGNTHQCGQHTDGSWECWGANLSGELDISPDLAEAWPGWGETCGIAPDGAIECVGYPTWDGQDVPVGEFQSVQAGPGMGCALATDGAIECWGYYLEGVIPGSYVQFAAAYLHMCALDGEGAMACWGVNGDGYAHALPGIYTALGSGTGSSNMCAISAVTGLTCWGSNNDYRQNDVDAWPEE